MKLKKHTEFEVKYRIDNDKVYKFKEILSEMPFKSFLFVEGYDIYYTKPDGSFLRYRKAMNEKRAEVSMKEKPEGANGCLIRKEVNWRVDSTPKDAIEEGAKMMGYNLNFSIYKMCHIYRMEDAILVFYTVRDDEKDIQSFVEIEIIEETVDELTKDQALGIIRKYEEKLSALGITYRNRMNKSLFELYKKDIYGTELKLKTYKEETPISEVGEQQSNTVLSTSKKKETSEDREGSMENTELPGKPQLPH